MAERCIIGIDVGTSGVKVLAIDDKAAILASVIEEYPLYTPHAGWTEQEPEDWWQGTVNCLRQIVGRLGGHTIAAIGLSGQMHGMVALDKDNAVVRRAILWNDQRTGKQCEEITAIAGGSWRGAGRRCGAAAATCGYAFGARRSAVCRVF